MSSRELGMFEDFDDVQLGEPEPEAAALLDSWREWSPELVAWKAGDVVVGARVVITRGKRAGRAGVVRGHEREGERLLANVELDDGRKVRVIVDNLQRLDV